MKEEPFAPEDGVRLLASVMAHRAFIASALGQIGAELQRRAHEHDLSKLQADELAGFSRINKAARVNKFGSPEYAEGMKRERDTIDLHFSRNRHHPERPKLMGEAAEKKRGLPDDFTYFTAHDAAAMTFVDVIEMVCDWWAAARGYGDTRPWAESVELNLKAKGAMLSADQRWLVRQVADFLARWEE